MVKKIKRKTNDFIKLARDVQHFTSLVDFNLLENYFAPQDERFSACMLNSTEIRQFFNGKDYRKN